MSKNLQVSVTKLHNKVVAVTIIDDEHRIAKVLWQASKPLSDEEIDWFIDDIVDAIGLNNDCMEEEWYARGRNVVKAVLERHGIK